MSRWHEPGCRRPEITFIDDIPCCNHCFALPSLDDTGRSPETAIPLAPRLESRAQVNLTWPSTVNYAHLSSPVKEDGDIYCPSGDNPPVSENIKYHHDLPKTPQQTGIHSEIMSNSRVRLLQLSPGQANSPIHGCFASTCLTSSSLPAYEAMSYTWADESGDTTRRCSVFFGPYWDIVYVTHNCAEALRAVRHLQSDRLVWIDSLCINQDSPDEKNHQVGLMREIYQNASTVIVYLGDASADSDAALTALKSAATLEWRTDRLESTSPGSRTALQCLFQRPYFSRLWVIQEILYAQRLTIICGCSDPRDMVFGVLGLIHGSDLSPDYGLSVESVYTGVAAYILKNHFAFEVLALAGIGKKDRNLPSWVPDWSQHQTLRFPKALFPSREECEDMTDNTLESAAPFIFDTMMDTDPELHIDIDNGLLQTHAVNICDISGEITRTEDPSYKVEHDSLFLLSGWVYPVILRQAGVNSYLLVSVCVLFFGPPSTTMWLCPGPDPIETPESSEIKVSRFSLDQKSLILALHSRLVELSAIQSSPVPFQVARARVLDFGCLSLTGLRDIESKLRNRWNEFDQNLGWMFRDPVAVRKFIHGINQENQNEYCGEDDVQLDLWESREFIKHCGVEFSTAYRWDLCQFCSSFIHPHDPDPIDLESTWNPIFPQLKAQLPEIQRWAETTEQLLKVFEYSQIILSKSWPVIPGAHLPDKWLQQWHGLNDAAGSGIQETNANQSHALGIKWDWSEFKASLSLRGQLWNERLPHLLDPSISYSMAAHLGLRSLGFYLDKQVTINIV